MIISIVGKGGSGKSSVATQVVLHALAQEQSVLAVDADHNMDLTYNLTNGRIPQNLAYLGDSRSDLEKTLGVQEGSRYADAFFDVRGASFSITPPDSFTERYSVPLSSSLRIMAAGPQNEAVLSGTVCSHSLSAPLKVYLPLLTLQENELVVLDEKAGADGAATGIVTGVHAAVIVCEPALHSVKTAKQLAELLAYYATPFVFIGNKITSDADRAFLTASLPFPPVMSLPVSETVKQNPSEIETSWGAPIRHMYDTLKKMAKDDRMARTKAKFEKSRTNARA